MESAMPQYKLTKDLLTIDQAVSFAGDTRILYFKSENSRIIEKAVKHATVLADYIKNTTARNAYWKELPAKTAIPQPQSYIIYRNLGSDEKTSSPPVLYLKNAHLYPQLFEMLTDFLELDYFKDSVLLLSAPYVSIPVGMEDSILLLDIKPPNLDDILMILRTYMESHKKSSDAASLDDTVLKQIAQTMAGFSEQQVLNVMSLHYLRSGGSMKDLTNVSEIIKLVLQERMAQMLKEPDIQLDTEPSRAQGLVNFQTWLDQEIPQLINYEENGRPYGLDRPKGVLLLGLPGTGKTEMARIARDKMSREYENKHMKSDTKSDVSDHPENSAVPLIQLNLQNLTSSEYGESEKKLTKYLDRIDAMAPVIVMLDEIDKTFVYDPDHGQDMHEVTKSLMRTLLSWMQGQKNPVFCYLAANNADKLPPELLRDGRLSERFFAFLPTQDELNDIINAQLCSLHAKTKDKNLFKEDMLKRIGYDESIHSYYKNKPGATEPPNKGGDFGRKLLKDAVQKNFEQNAGSPKKLFMTGANTAKLINMTLKKLKNSEKTPPYSMTDFQDIILKLLLSDEFIPYGESNITQIVKLWLYTYENRYRCVSDRYIPDPKEYDSENKKFRKLPTKEEAKKDYNTYMEYTLKNAILTYTGNPPSNEAR